MKEKLIAALLAVCMAFTASSCGIKDILDRSDDRTDDQAEAEETAWEEEEEYEEDEDSDLPTSVLIDVDSDPLPDGMGEVSMPIETGYAIDRSCALLDDPCFDEADLQEGDSFDIYYCCGVLPYAERQTEYVFKTHADYGTMEDVRFYVTDPEFAPIQILYVEYTGSNPKILDQSQGAAFLYSPSYGNINSGSMTWKMYIGAEICAEHYDDKVWNDGWGVGSEETADEVFDGRYNFVPLSEAENN